MGSVLAIISKAAFAKLRTHDDNTPVLGTQIEISRYESNHPTLDALKDGGWLFLVTVKPDDTLWLAAALPVPTRRNHGWQSPGSLMPVVDITPLCKELGLERGDGKLAMRLQSPRVLDQRVEAILMHIEAKSHEAFKRKKSYVLDVPKSVLQLPRVPAAKPASKPKPVKGGKLPALAGNLGEPCMTQIDEVLDELIADPVKFLSRKTKGKRGKFTETVQSIFAGAVDAAEAKRMLEKELHPWVDDATKKAMKKAKGDLDDYFGELVDSVAIRAIEDLCAGIVAFAIDRIEWVPMACTWYVDPLHHYAKALKPLLGVKEKPTTVRPAKKVKKVKPPPKGQFKFVNCRTLDGDAVVAETPVHQAQFIEAMGMYSGERGDTAAAVLDAYRKKNDLFARSDFHIELWDVIEGGRTTPRFEYWVQGAGDGTIFDYGTDESPNSIGSTQHRFEAHGGDDDDKEMIALVEALQTASDRDL